MADRRDTTDEPHPLVADVAQAAVVEFMRDWNHFPPEDCAWRMFARLKTALAHMKAVTNAD